MSTSDPWRSLRNAMSEDPEGVRAVLAVADRFGFDRAELAWVVRNESGWKPQATNPQSGAYGLIQFMPKTRELLGMGMPETRLEQAPFVEEFFRRVVKNVGEIPRGDLRLAIFNPAHVGKPDSYVLYDVGSKAWEQNPSLRESPEGPITAGSVRRKGDPPSRPDDLFDIFAGGFDVDTPKADTVPCPPSSSSQEPLLSLHVRVAGGEPVLYVLQRGAWGALVVVWRKLLDLKPSHDFDFEADHATRRFQLSRGLKVDGIVGPKTWSEMLCR